MTSRKTIRDGGTRVTCSWWPSPEQKTIKTSLNLAIYATFWQKITWRLHTEAIKVNHPLNILTRGRFGFQNSFSVHITWLGQGAFTYEKPSYLKKTNYIFWKKTAFHRHVRYNKLFF
jgi:hypothetical protein